MSHPLLSARLSAQAPHPRDAAQSLVARPPAWAARPETAGAEVAVLITGCRDMASALRGYRTVLPRARIWFHGAELAPGEIAEAEAAGAERLLGCPCSRDALVRRLFAEVEADIYILAHGAGADDVCVAPLIVAEIDAGRDLVDVRSVADAPRGDAADRLLAGAVDFAYGRGGDALRSDFKACSRRFALSYRQTPPQRDGSGTSARHMVVHALRLRLAVGRVSALGFGRDDAGPPATRGIAGWAAVLGTVARLLVEERPRRVLGLIGLGLMGLGVAAATPELKIHHWRAFLPAGAKTLASGALLAAGATLGAAGVLLDTLASARQEVARLGVAAIARRADRGPDQSSVS